MKKISMNSSSKEFSAYIKKTYDLHEKSEETGLSNLIYGLAKYLFVNFSIDVFEDEDGLAKILHGICDTAFFNMLSDSEITEKYDDAGIDAIVYIDKW